MCIHSSNKSVSQSISKILLPFSLHCLQDTASNLMGPCRHPIWSFSPSQCLFLLQHTLQLNCKSTFFCFKYPSLEISCLPVRTPVALFYKHPPLPQLRENMYLLSYGYVFIPDTIFCPSLKHFFFFYIVAKTTGFGVRCSWNIIPVVLFISREILSNFFKCCRSQVPHGKAGDGYIFVISFVKEYL